MLFASLRRGQVLYEPLKGQINEADAPPWSKQSSTSQNVFGGLRVNIWALLTCIFASTTVVLLYQQHRLTGGRSYEHGFATELAAARSAINLVSKSFTGGLAVEENGTWVRRVDPASLQYVGAPSDAIDKAWYDLILPINIDLTGDEADDLQDTLVWPGTDKHFSGLAVHHSLHCVNLLRMAIYRDYYPFPDGAKKIRFTWNHLDHCIDFIRQVVQCHGDLTPMKWYWSDAVNGTVLKEESIHTCRSWGDIQEWATQRKHALTKEQQEKLAHKPTHGSWSPFPTAVTSRVSNADTP